jgi:hypothetical protein
MRYFVALGMQAQESVAEPAPEEPTVTPYSSEGSVSPPGLYGLLVTSASRMADTR